MDYSFYVTALNPLESVASPRLLYRAGGLPTAPGAITEIPQTRTGQRIGLQWQAPSSDGGSAITVYTLALVQENQQD